MSDIPLGLRLGILQTSRRTLRFSSLLGGANDYFRIRRRNPPCPFLTRAIVTLHAHLLGSVFTLAETRVLIWSGPTWMSGVMDELRRLIRPSLHLYCDSALGLSGDKSTPSIA